MANGRIYYFTTTRHRYTLKRWFDPPPGPEDPEVIHLTYRGLEQFAETEPPAGTYVFTDLDRLAATQMRAAVRLAVRVRSAGGTHRVANWPNRVMNRYELLATLHKTGINRFGCSRFEAHERITRYPVFLRILGRHGGPASKLLDDAGALRSAMREALDAGHRREDILIVEFQDTDRFDGHYVTYGAYCAFGRVFPADIAVASDWVAKYNVRIFNDAVTQFETDYVRHNPHAGAIAAVFRHAGIDWGRIDYSRHDGRIQVFEINTNPDLVAPRTWENLERRNAHVLPFELPNVRAAFRRLAAAAVEPEESLPAPA